MGNSNRFYVDIMALHEEVTGSCNFVVVKLPDGKTIRFIVDCGLFQEEEYGKLNQTFPFNADNLDFCLVTHVHVDHIGRLPLLTKNGFSNNIYATRTTCKFLPAALKDSSRILQSTAKRKHTKPLYPETEVENVLQLLTPCDFEETIKINDHIKVTFLNNGHLLGAAMILVQISAYDCEDINLLFTGDYNNKNIFFKVKPVPKWILNLPLTVIQESTYGDTNSNEAIKCFKKNILECLNGEGTVVAPVFSLGRSQEILYELKLMQETGKLPLDIPIYFDGNLAIKYTRFYIEDELGIDESMRDFLPKNLTFLDKISRQDVLKDTGRKIILTTSGMGSYGPSQVYIPEYISRKRALIQFTGYTAEGTLGNKLKIAEVGDAVTIEGLVVKKQAKVEYTTEYSAHAKADEMIDFLKQFKNLQVVLINHGESEVKDIFAKRVVSEVNTRRVAILGRTHFFRINQYGLQKSLSTKFLM